MGKLSMCRICLAENVRMCVVTDKSLQETYEKLTDVPFVTEDRKPMLACFFCCTRLKQCCQLQRKCVEAEELLAQMLSEDCEKKPLMNREQLGFVGGYITTPVENISIVDDCQIGSDAIKQELPAVCEEQDEVEIQLTHLSEELIPENLYNSHPDVEAHHSSEPQEYQCGMQIKIEIAEQHEETDKLDLQNPDKSYPGVEDIPAHVEIKIEAEDGPEVSKRKQGVSANQRAAIAKKPSLKRKLEVTIPAKQTMNVLSDSKIIRTTETSESIAKINEPITATSQSHQPFNLIQHTQTPTGDNRLKCDICQRSFSNKSNLNKHFRIHTGEKRYKCDVCQRSFSLRSTLKLHSRIHTGEKPYQCDVCQRSFICKSNLNAHLRKHSVEKPFKCDVCQRSFKSKNSLNVHLRNHSGEKPFKCDVCQRSFFCQSNLNVHFRVHTGEKPFKCDVCQHSFTFQSHLKEHMRQHSGEKPFKCDVCLRSFSQSAHLKQHMRVHTGEKPYKCEVCQQSFSLKNSLTVHLRKHTGENPFKCDVCQRSLTCKRNFEEHLRRKHSSV